MPKLHAGRRHVAGRSHAVHHGTAHCVPIVLVPGFLGPAKDEDDFDDRRRVYKYWGEAQTLGTPDSPVLSVWPGGLSSLHDRACELFYQIKGGVVDYGQGHSHEFGHERFGRKYLGSYPSWSRDCPIHIVGHSLGGSTARMLQVLLASGSPLHCFIIAAACARFSRISQILTGDLSMRIPCCI